MGVMKEAMLREMALRGFAPRTQKVYVSWVKRLVSRTRVLPDKLSESQVRTYLAGLAQAGLSASTLNQAISAVRFFFNAVLHRERPLELRYQRAPQLSLSGSKAGRCQTSSHTRGLRLRPTIPPARPPIRLRPCPTFRTTGERLSQSPHRPSTGTAPHTDSAAARPNPSRVLAGPVSASDGTGSHSLLLLRHGNPPARRHGASGRAPARTMTAIVATNTTSASPLDRNPSASQSPQHVHPSLTAALDPVGRVTVLGHA
jgi:hypothetical protein